MADRRPSEKVPEKYTMEWVAYYKNLLKTNPNVGQYLNRNDFEMMAATSQEELDLLKRYHGLLNKVRAQTSDWKSMALAGGYDKGVAGTQAELSKLASQLSRIREAGERAISETYWTPGGAGYWQEEPVAAPKTNLDLDSYIKTLQAQGIPPSQWAARSTGLPQEGQAYIAQKAQELATPLGTPPATGIPNYALPTMGEQPTQPQAPSLEDWMNVDWASIYGGYIPPEATGGYQPTLAGAGMPLAGTPTQPQTTLEDWMNVDWSSIYSVPFGTTAQSMIEAGQPVVGDEGAPPAEYGWEGGYPPGTLTIPPGEEPSWWDKLWGAEAAPGGVVPGYFASPYDIPPEILENYDIIYDPTMMAWRADPKAPTAGMSEFEQWYMKEKLALDQRAFALRQQQQQWEQAQAGQLTEWQKQQLELEQRRIDESREMTEYQAAQLAQQQEYQTWQMGQAEREYEAQLAARGPGAWLESAAYKGETPVIQPWMKPLAAEQYGWGATPQVGQPIPGWTKESAQGMPELTRPSRQYQARMGPTALQQLYGYEQARTGATPEETQWRQWSVAPPGGTAPRLSYAR